MSEFGHVHRLLRYQFNSTARPASLAIGPPKRQRYKRYLPLFLAMIGNLSCALKQYRRGHDAQPLRYFEWLQRAVRQLPEMTAVGAQLERRSVHRLHPLKFHQPNRGV